MPRARRSIAIQTRIIEAAASAFARDGYRDTSVRAVCAAARVNIAAVNYHFGGKARLFRAALEYAVTRGGVVRAVSRMNREPGEALREQVTVMIGAIRGDGPASLLWRIAAREATGPAARTALIRDALAPDLAALHDGIARTRAPTAHAEEIERSLTALLAICLHWGHARRLISSDPSQDARDGEEPVLTAALLVLSANSSPARP